MKLSLSVDSISALEKQIRKSITKVRTAPAKINAKLLKIGSDEADSNILKSEAADGNTDITLNTTFYDTHGVLSIDGADVAYQEFGYGLVGQSERNPKQPPSYQQSNKKAWIYKSNGEKRWSHGMTANMPMYQASKAMRAAIPNVITDVVKEAIKIV